jgi:hypothetical protein
MTSVVAVPEGIEFGDIWLTVGLGFVTVNATEPDVPPPGDGFVTVMLPIAPAARFPDGITAVSCVPETNVVFKACPFRFATESETKPLPEIVTVVSDAPAATEFGLIFVTLGTGFGADIGPIPTPFPPPLQPKRAVQMKIANIGQTFCILFIVLFSVLKVVSL